MILLLSSNIDGSPPRDSRDIRNKEIVGQATNIITAKLLKGGIENNKNSVFSPIGYASILAILAEGAQEDTIHDINTVLKHPDDRGLVRSAYRSVLSHLQGTDPHTAPQFRSWFYIYKNNTIEESYQKLLMNDYYVTVRNVEPFEPQEQQNESAQSAEKPADEPAPANLSEIQVKSSEATPTNSKDIVQFDSFKNEAGPVDETRIDSQKDASKFDEVVEDRQYVEVPVIKDKMKQTDEKEEVKSVEGKSAEGTTVLHENEAKIVPLPLKQYEEMEIMQAEESRLGKAVSKHNRSLIAIPLQNVCSNKWKKTYWQNLNLDLFEQFGGKSGEGASIISGNSIIGEKENLTDSDEDRFEPKMLLFNGLYYHGNWATPFQVR